MGGVGRTCCFLPTLRGRDSRLEIAKRRCARAARLLGQPFVLATNRARTQISGGWVYLHRPIQKPDNDKSLLKSSTLKEVESAESSYERAIDKLAAETKPQLENPATPLLANYHEKLLVLDSAIADLRAQAGLNPSNAQLRYQLLAMYREKQHTLEEVLEAKP